MKGGRKMNLDELIGVKMYKDIKTGEELSHSEIQKRIIRKLGYKNVKKCIPFHLERLKEMYAKDKNMNIRMDLWDKASGIGGVIGQASRPYYIYNELYYLLRKNGVNSWSQSQGVCILKECARMWILESEGKLNDVQYDNI